MVHVNTNYTFREDYGDDIAVLVKSTPWVGLSGTNDFIYVPGSLQGEPGP